ncbi:bifunctional preprotein translocase subunit SecD/SecF [Anaerohalosphaera lusitana]|uniref:Multifunctional fusion protein n=1 Tax=Anaerohalosphaera lusitana TaxID=1936003 RepID=A0A1U9NMY2_9BACT|nr:protein translocase subunit SecD [Anaerohalosphaera lusitana]AQT68866.1 bifunctional preprotein translocase subunit SecD/SecF [Anaerohalosphaera lusitana]
MGKNQTWKIILILALVVFALYQVYPPQDKLKPGLDLAGGTKLIYDFNTQGMSPDETEGLAESQIPILRKRIDPQNVANLVIRPLGDTRIEIQQPLASKETIEKRKAYQQALDSLEDENLNLMRVKRALAADKEERQEVFAEFAGDSETRNEILTELASTYDRLTALQSETEQLEQELETLQKKVDAAGLSGERLSNQAVYWNKLEGEELQDRIDTFVGETEEAKPFVEQYIEKYGQLANKLNQIADPEDGARVAFKDAEQRLNQLNLSITRLKEILDLPEDSVKRTEMLNELKERFPAREEKIENVIEAYAEYAPGAGRLDDPEDLKRMLRGSGKLEFRILPTMRDGTIAESKARALVEALQTRGPQLASTNEYKWVEVEDWENYSQGTGITGTFGEKHYVLASDQPGETMLHTGDEEWSLQRAYPTVDQNGRRAIGFEHGEIAANMFYRLTNNNIGRPLAILLDNKVISAPKINDAIRSSGIITGEFTPTERDDMISKLNAGSFQASLSEAPSSEQTIGPTLGTENRDRGIKAGIYGVIIVAVFMLVYYLLAGSIADIALLMNILFVLAMMVTLNATFTLPGIAGLILTIGMSVDANVLIFERIREEQKQGSSLRSAIANGYQRAFRTILDANITTFFVALILYMVASEEIKGFAIVLMLGIISSMFTALFVTRVVFNFLLDKRVIKDHLVMLQLVGTPKINWMSVRKVFFSVSTILIVGGLAVFFLRDEQTNSKYDIEFTGGTSVQIDLKEGHGLTTDDIAAMIHQKGEEIGSPALQTAKVYTVGESGDQFQISTTETNNAVATIELGEGVEATTENVQAQLQKAMSDTGTLYDLQVNKQDSQFTVKTTTVNKPLVSQTIEEAFGDNVTIEGIEVNEVVSEAVRDTFEGLLDVRENLEPQITAAEQITEATPELSEYLGGVMITVELDNSATFGEIQSRFADVRFKPTMANMQWYNSQLFAKDMTIPEPGTELSEFVYVSVHPEAGYREFSEDEWQSFIEGEKSKVLTAASMEESLSRVTQVDPSIGQQAKVRAIIAIVLSLIAIVAYIWIRFGTARYGFAAIAALIHDVCITLGAVTVCTFIAKTSLGRALGIMDFKINLEMIAAFLTIIGYSLNDTIVVFDRIRENRGKGKLTPHVVSNSINQTISRTLLTSFTTFVVVLVMYIWGGEGLRGFTFAMLIGIIVGTYSSIGIAAPILLTGSAESESETK